MNYLRKYSDFLKKFLKPKTRIKVVFDCSNGPTSLVLKELFKNNGLVKAIIINSRVDGRFPAHSPNPLERGSQKDLVKAVLKHKADLGVIFDADGDRVIFISDKGLGIGAEEATRLMIDYLRPHKVILDTMAGFLARSRDVSPSTTRIINSKVGIYFMKAAMIKKRADFGSEWSGHYYFKKFYYSDSGILASVIMINIVSLMKKRGLPISDQLRGLPRYYSSLRNYPLKVSDQAAAIGKLKAILKKKRRKFISVDGITLKGKKLWWNLRASNTEPLLRVKLEAKTPEAFNKENRFLIGLLKEAGLKTTIQR